MVKGIIIYLICAAVLVILMVHAIAKRNRFYTLKNGEFIEAT